MNELSHKTELPDWYLGQLADEPLHAGLAVDGERVGHDVVEPAEQVRLEQKNWNRWKQKNEIIENNNYLKTIFIEHFQSARCPKTTLFSKNNKKQNFFL